MRARCACTYPASPCLLLRAVAQACAVCLSAQASLPERRRPGDRHPGDQYLLVRGHRLRIINHHYPSRIAIAAPYAMPCHDPVTSDPRGSLARRRSSSKETSSVIVCLREDRGSAIVMPLHRRHDGGWRPIVVQIVIVAALSICGDHINAIYAAAAAHASCFQACARAMRQLGHHAQPPCTNHLAWYGERPLMRCVRRRCASRAGACCARSYDRAHAQRYRGRTARGRVVLAANEGTACASRHLGSRGISSHCHVAVAVVCVGASINVNTRPFVVVLTVGCAFAARDYLQRTGASSRRSSSSSVPSLHITFACPQHLLLPRVRVNHRRREGRHRCAVARSRRIARCLPTRRLRHYRSCAARIARRQCVSPPRTFRARYAPRASCSASPRGAASPALRGAARRRA